MTTEPFKPGEKVWYGEWWADQFHRLIQTVVVCGGFQDHDYICVMIDDMWQFSPVENLERIHTDLNERLK